MFRSIAARSMRLRAATRLHTSPMHINTARRSSPVPLTSPSSFQRRWATGTTLASSPSDPAQTESLKALEEGTQKLEDGDIEGAKASYRRSLDVHRSASALFNYGVTCYHTKDFTAAVDAWKESIELQPDSADAHTNLASAYIMMPLARPDLALKHLRQAAVISPEDGEIAFNLGAVLEAAGHLEDALTEYKRSKEYGVDKAGMHVRNVSAKILGKKLKEAAEEEAKAESQKS